MTTRPSFSSTGVVAVVLGGALVVGGCGAAQPPATSASAGTPTSAAATGGDTVDSRAFGVDLVNAMVAAKSGRSTMTLDTSGAAATAGPGAAGRLSMTMDFVFNDAKQMNMHAKGDSGGQPFEMVVVDGVSYLKSGTPVGGKSWLKLPASSELASSTDPVAMANGFAGATIKKVGTDGGLTRYSLTGVSGGGDMEVYLDGSGRPAKMVVSGSGVKVNAEYKDWGTAVTVTAPPAGEVAEVPAGAATGTPTG